ncbi:MAG: hypothetical protein P8J17_12795 [Halioglobus sp.]|nr:hypothetical protein [Halioglobus sp.]
MDKRFERYDGLLVVLFTLLLLLPLGAQILEDSTENGNVLLENRNLSAVPVFPKQIDELMAYPGEFDAFFNDNFGLRTPILSVAHSLKLATQVPLYSSTLSGKKGWFFLRRQSFSENPVVSAPLEKHELDEFSARLRRLEVLLNEKGIAFVHFSAPEKQSIYPEYLPMNVNFSEITPLEQVNAELAKSNAYVNVKSIMLEVKANHPEQLLYYKIDTHWNCLGAYIAYREVAERVLGIKGAETPLVSETDFVFRDTSNRDKHNPFSLEYWRSSLRKKDTAFECLLEESPQIEAHLRLGKQNIPNINGENITPAEALDFPTLIFKDWESTDTRGKAGLKAIVLRDSFASRLVPYLSRTFSEVLYLHFFRLENNKLKHLIEDFQPDVLIFEYAERFLDSPNRNLMDPIERSLQGADELSTESPSDLER